MGLDMYLSKHTYVKNWAHMKDDEKHKVVVKKGGKLRKDIKPERVSYIVEEVAYWRKANAIHKWFVDHVQDGVDNCQTSYVSTEQLSELVDLCRKVLSTVETVPGDVTNGVQWTPDGGAVKLTEPGQVIAQPGIASEILPTTAGFFFGSTDYDQYYLDDLRDTIRQIEPLLKEEGEFYYHASW